MIRPMRDSSRRGVLKAGGGRGSLLLVWGWVALSASGCGLGLFQGRFEPVAGVVQLDGKPLTSGTIMFVPVGASHKSTTTRVATALITPNGKFRLTTELPGDGAVQGEYNVILMPIPADGRVLESASNPSEAAGAAPSTPSTVIPQVYLRPETTPLTMTVKRGVNLMKLDLLAR